MKNIVAQFPLVSNDKKYSFKTLQIADDLKTLNIRKAPAKKNNVFFTTSPKNKAASAKSKMKKDMAGQAWFDLDSVYGFTSED